MVGGLLSVEEIRRLRASVRAAESKPKPDSWRWATYVNGPLAGLRSKLEANIHDAPDATIGWCIISRWGAVAAYYRQSGVPGEWRFSGYHCPGEPWRGWFCLLAVRP